MSLVETETQFVPAEMKVKPNWVRWNLEEVGGRLTKVPYQLNGNKASSTDSSTWATYKNVANNFMLDETQGLGIVCDGSFIGFDLDGCRNPETGEITAWAKRVIDALGTYTEITPSGTGVRAYALGQLPEGARRFSIATSAGFGDKVGIETYDSSRYFAVTGNRISSTSSMVSSNVEKAYQMCAEISREYPSDKRKSASHFNTTDSNPNSSVVFETSGTYATSKLAVLTYGTITSEKPFVIEDEHGNKVTAPSQSEADMSLATLLAMKHGDNSELIDSDFRESSLYRSKWDRLGESTIQKAIQTSKRLTQTKIVVSQDGSVNSGVSDDGFVIDRPKNLTEVGNGRRLLEAYGKNLRYATDLDLWFIYDKGLWIADRRSKKTQDLLKQVLIGIQLEAAKTIIAIPNLDALRAKITKNGTLRSDAELTEDEVPHFATYQSAKALSDWAKTSESNQKIHGAVEQAKTEPGVAIKKTDFDSNRLLCNLQNGSLEFDREKVTATFRSHSREDLCTRMMPMDYAEGADCPKFKEFLNWMFSGDQEVVRYLQTFFGLCLTGVVVRAVLILYGEGRNGKSTLVSIMSSMLGNKSDNYGISVAFSTFSAGREETAGGTRADLLPLNGPRLITAAESNKQKVRLDMARIKELTGGDQTVARGLYAP